MTFNYIGKTYKNCDPSAAQKAGLASSQGWQTLLSGAYKTVFGTGSTMFNQISQGLDGIIAKGREAMGYSPEELADKNAQSINAAAASAKDVNRAIGTNAARGGAVPGVESGVVQAERAGADTSIMNNMSNRQAQITDEGYQVQREAFDKAVQEKESSLGASFNPSTSMDTGVNAANETVNQQANNNQQTQSSWMGLVGGVADKAASAAMMGA
jgi:hypothetical protein